MAQKVKMVIKKNIEDKEDSMTLNYFTQEEFACNCKSMLKVKETLVIIWI